MDDLLSKPIDPKELNSALLKWLPGKMTMTDKSHAEAEEDTSEYDILLDELSDVEGMDIHKGLAHSGGKKSVFISILRQACAEIGGYVDEIRKFQAEENWHEYSIRIHAMKSAFANIGAETISKWAYELEYASKNGDTDRCVRETDAICNEMTALRDALLRTALMHEEEEEKIPMDAPVITQKLEELKEACWDGRSDEAEEIASELAKAAFSKPVEDLLLEIRRLVKSYDYEKVIELADSLPDCLPAQQP
jgi:HPt (histidine-containing phosphotransfer) domain-containing protein